jgi:hypothetical protein
VFLATRDSNYVARGVFFSDNRGNIFYVTLENPNTNSPYDNSDLQRTNPWNAWDIYTVASLRETRAAGGDLTKDSYSIPWGVVASSRRSSNKLWVGGGTANTARADPQGYDQHLRNESQMIFAFVMPDITDVTGDATEEGSKVSIRGNWARLSAGSNNVPSEEETKLQNGWYIPLQGDNDTYLEEYVTIRPILSEGIMYIATFMQQKININDASATCETSGGFTGKSRLYAISLEDGSGKWEGNGKYHEYEGVKIVNATDMGDGTTAFGAAALDPSKEGIESLRKDEDGNLYLVEVGKENERGGTSPGEDGGSSSPIKPNDTIINYWLSK